MPEEADGDHDVPLERQPLLHLKEILFEARAAEGYDFVVADQEVIILVLSFP